MPYVNGKSAELIIKIAGMLLFLLIVAYTLIVMSGNEVPQDFEFLATTLVTGIIGFLAGSRVVPPDVSAVIKSEPLTPEEKATLPNNDESR